MGSKTRKFGGNVYVWAGYYAAKAAADKQAAEYRSQGWLVRLAPVKPFGYEVYRRQPGVSNTAA